MRFVLLLVAAVIAIVAAVAALKFTGGNKTETPAADATTTQTRPTSSNLSTVDVLVARDLIPVGTVIEESMLSKQPWPSHLVLESFVVADSPDGKVVGKVARSTFMAYEPLLKTRLADPNDPSFLAATLPHGMRAMTLATDAVSGVAGYIFPGDRVDVIVTHNVPKEAKLQRSSSAGDIGTSNKPAFSEVLVPNARVLAVNVRRVDTPEARPANPAPTSITIEVPEKMAQEVRLAEKLGTLSLTLRSLKDISGDIQIPPPTTIDDLTRAETLASGGTVRIVRGVETEDDYENNVSTVKGTTSSGVATTEGSESENAGETQ